SIAVLTIVDDDPTPTLSINDVPVTEGSTGTVNVVFTVSLSAASGRPVTVDFATNDGTATAGPDYQARSGTLTFNPGETTKTITVQVTGARVGEPDESFFVNLASATNALIADSQGLGIVADDEPRISISDVTVQEGDRGDTLFIFIISLSAAY